MDTNGASGQPGKALLADGTAAQQTPESPHLIATQLSPPDLAASDHPDAPLIALEQERADLRAQANGQDGDKEANAIQDRGSVLENTIAQLPAYSPVGIAIKLRRIQRTFKDSGGAPWDQANFDTALEALDRMGDVSLILWKQEHDRLYGGTYKEGEELSRVCDKCRTLVKSIIKQPARTTVGITIKLRLMRSYMEHSDCDWFDRCWDSCLASLANMAGTPTPVPSAIPIGDNPDAKLFAFETEMAVAHEGLDTADNTDEARKPWHDCIMATHDAAIATPAQTAEGVAAKLRMAVQMGGAVPDTDQLGLELVRNATQDAQRIRAGSVDPSDAVLASLWQQRQNNYAAVPPGEDIDDATSERATKFEEQIVETPAQGLLGIAIKLRINAEAITPNSRYITHRAVRAALDDAERLAGIGSAP